MLNVITQMLHFEVKILGANFSCFIFDDWKLFCGLWFTVSILHSIYESLAESDTRGYLMVNHKLQ